MQLPFSMDGTSQLEAQVRGAHFRFTLLTERILRMEYDPEGIFEDRPSQTVLNRNFPVPRFHVRDTGDRLEIQTENYHLIYQYGKEERFTPNSLTVDAKNSFTNYGARWQFGNRLYGDPPRHHNLYGTARTLDRADGPVDLDWGLMSSAGHSWFDDSETALLAPDGTLIPRRSGTVDVYYLCGQRDFGATLKDFYALTGKPPMLPRYALGNWWSRYYAYTAEEYEALTDRFRKENLPFSMAVLDMDWHITKVDPKYGKGWTGHTWNRELFPDPKGFLQLLHDRGMHTILNLHPADGVQGYEDAYPAMAKATGADASKEEPVPFDMTDPVFTKAYFDCLMRPLEEEGVDHWWIDWQQGRKCAVPGLDPLWLLNHYHYCDNCRDGKRGLILSRYAGLGSHRYPVGFSGDTVSSWDSLNFQAYFTLTSANVGFPFWSHDIGGFTAGVRDPELFIRWLQLGVFSPIVRLHATRNPFASKEPWNFGKNAAPVIGKWLRLRHQLIPYLYTETHRQHTKGDAMIRPVYYDYPMGARVYADRETLVLPLGQKPFAAKDTLCKNQYFFGSSLLVCPITAPADPLTGLASCKAWIPDGIWTDFFTGKTYEGDRVAVLNRSVEQYPVLAKAGAIVPTAVLEEGSNSTENPAALDVFVFPGGSGSYTMYEDDGVSLEADRQFVTEFAWDGKTFTARGTGDAALVPAKRKYRIHFRGFENFTPKGEGIEKVTYDPQTRTVTAELAQIAPTEGVTLDTEGARREENRDYGERIFDFLMFAKMNPSQKLAIHNLVQRKVPALRVLEELQTNETDRRLTEVITELLL